MENIYTAIRCPKDLREKAIAKAKRANRSLSNYIIHLIDRDTASDPARKINHQDTTTPRKN